ncbi:MAG TPA: DNA polymerase III subunit delta' [Gemmatales bacterium]|nr:DNA polymerase III subunit delta' [Gemmatales bacterium]
MPWLGIYGHDVQCDALLRAWQADRLGHSYLFVGPEGVGKKRFALALAQAISCESASVSIKNPEPCGTCTACVQIKAGTYPDLHLAGLPEDKQEFPTELMKELIQSLGVKPQRAGARRIAIIDDADAFNSESANRFLKTLEEPPPDSLLILIGTAAERQLDTIRSRCQLIRFQPLGLEDFTQAAVNAGIVAHAAEAQKLFPLAHGSLSKAELLKDEELQKITLEIAKALQQPKFAGVAFGTLLVKFAEGVKDSPQKRQRARFAVEFIVQLLQAALLHAEHGQAQSTEHQAAVQRLASLPSMGTLPALIEACLEAEHHIDRRFQLALLLEAFAERLGRELR